MQRIWEAWNQKRYEKELAALPLEDHKALVLAMEAYRQFRESGFTHKHYPKGVEMVTDAGNWQGRCLFFSLGLFGEVEILVVVLVYKKETQELPTQILRLAQDRKRDYLNETK